MSEQDNTKERVLVVRELPTQEVNRVKDDKTGKIVRLMTIEEALTELLNR